MAATSQTVQIRQPTGELGPESKKNYEIRLKEGFIARYLSGDQVLDIGYRGGTENAVPITEKAIGIELDYPGYDGKTLPFSEQSQDAVYSSHCLEHIDDYATVLADWYRVLKIGGFMIVMVPHRDLYERKASLPSRYNGDHKRFYTPASLLTEIELSLPVAGYRVRSLRDLDTGFDYMIPPETAPAGSYEIELVLEKIAIPYYSKNLRPPSGTSYTGVPDIGIRKSLKMLWDGTLSLFKGLYRRLRQLV